MGGLPPFALSPSYEFTNDFTFDFPIEEKAPAPLPDPIQIKQEPSRFPFPQESSAQTPVQTDLGSTYNGLAPDQQLALQQLMTNILTYQQHFGLVDPVAPAAPPQQTTIQPSMVFSTSPTAPASSVSSTLVSPSSLQPAPPILSQPEDEMALRSIRQESIFSFPSDGNAESKIDRLLPLPAIFSVGRGKGGKKGGGMSSVVRGDDEDIDDEDLWRPSPEEYKKLSSKEKRQLRNKLSARAFRTRRKDYIGTLEAHIQDRETVIDEIRSELVNSRSENQDLRCVRGCLRIAGADLTIRRELNALKTSTMSILHPESANVQSQPPALFSAFAMSPSIPAAVPSTVRHSSPPIINTRKDLPASYESSRAFWGGSDSTLFGGGSTICHTTFTPDLVLPAASTFPNSIADLPRVNLNPLLNDKDKRVPSLASTADGKELSNTFSEWSEINAFTLRSMDSYRMQMWSRLAREAAADKSNLAPDLRPKFLVEGKAPICTSTTPSTAEALTPSSAAQLAHVATAHITSKLASSFWSAFSGPGAKLDTDKLTAVVTGTARLGVVDINEKNDEADNLVVALGGLRLQTGGRNSEAVRVRENPLGAIGSFFKRGPIHAGV